MPKLHELVKIEEQNLLQLLCDVADAADAAERLKAETALSDYSGSLALRQKVDAYSSIMAWFDGQLASTKAEADRLKRRRKSIETAKQSLENHALFALSLVDPVRGVQKLEGNHSTLTLRDCPVHVDLDHDWSTVPERFVKVTVTMPLPAWRALDTGMHVDRIEHTVMLEAIREAIENGEEVPGASLSQNVRVQRT